MSTAQSHTTPYWSTSAALPPFARLSGDAEADVVVIGGGITGLTAGYLLARAGKKVIVLERGRCAATDTGHTSAHLTMVTDTRLRDLVKSFGRTHAQAVWDAGLAAIATIDDIVREHDIDASFQWVDGYLHAPLDSTGSDQSQEFEAEAALAGELGFDAEYVESVPLMGHPGVRFPGQARIHPRQYLAGVAKALVALGGRIHEHSEAGEFCTDPRRVMVDGHAVTCDDVIIATHNPLVGFGGMAGATLFQTKLALYTSYVIAGRVARGVLPDALWWDTADPYRFVRIEPRRDHDVVIFGGEDHKTGQQDDTEACYRRLEERLRALIPTVHLTHRWSGQVIETPDGLPYIGQSAEHQYSATGYGGNGLTFGTLGGMMMSDAVLGRSNPWTELFDPGRKAITRGLWDYITENVDYPYYLIRDRFAGAEAKSLRAVKRGEGKIIERKGAKVAAFRDKAGSVTLLSAICTHMGCTVGWNTAEQTWDCPCHGSRFTVTGDVISGPAETPLPKAE
ncbi:MAG TPA: FAD-dependent oxidoreductase [Vicinamibacterales bacterium]|nr:FAD-dependent oxidoreductase [Vicinamibacterales bacterium]